MPAHRTLYRISVTVFMASLVAVSLIGPNYKSPSSISTIAIIIFGSLMSVPSLSLSFGGYHAIPLLDICRTKVIRGQRRRETEVTQECQNGFKASNQIYIVFVVSLRVS